MLQNSPLVVVYDGYCALCRASKDKLEKMFGDRIAMVDFRVTPPESLHPDLNEEACQARMHVVADGRAYGGAAAMVRLFRLHPVLRWPVLLYHVPPLGWLAERVYDLVSRNRFTLSKWIGGEPPACTDACSIHPPEKKKK